MAETELAPKGAFQTKLNGGVELLPIDPPLAKYWTLVTPVGALAKTVSSRLVPPSKAAPSAGLVIRMYGVPMESYTITGTRADSVCAPWSSVATAESRCGPTEGVSHDEV